METRFFFLSTFQEKRLEWHSNSFERQKVDSIMSSGPTSALCSSRRTDIFAVGSRRICKQQQGTCTECLWLGCKSVSKHFKLSCKCVACNDLKNEDGIDSVALSIRVTGKVLSSQSLPPTFVLVLKWWDMMHVVKVI